MSLTLNIPVSLSNVDAELEQVRAALTVAIEDQRWRLAEAIRREIDTLLDLRNELSR